MNIVLVLIDTLRADHLGCYGYHHPTSPTLDRLAAEGVLFENCFAQGIPTTPAHATIYTGRHPIVHQIVTHGGDQELSKEFPLFPELLIRHGYTTCAADLLYDLKPWFSRGYEFYINPSLRRPLGLMISCEQINARAVAWLKAHARERFFLFVHYWEPHTPYLPPPRYRIFYQGDPSDPHNRTLEGMERHPLGRLWRETWFPKLGAQITDGNFIVGLYDGEIRHADDGLAALLRALDETGRAEDTLVLVTSDHGETFYERGIFFDHHGLYDENLRVPLVCRWPTRLPAGRRVPHLVRHVDLAPTILEAAGVPIPEGLDGRSLLPLMTGESDEPLVDRFVAEECTWQAKWCLRTETHKFILAREPDFYGTPPRELYDLRTDPQERHNLAEVEPQLAAQMEAELEGWIAAQLQALGRTEDPLREQGITLGRRWKEEREREGK